MAASTPFDVTISNVAGALFAGKALSLRLPGSEGEMVVLARHEPIIALLKEGTITLTTETGEMLTYPVSKGVLEVSNNKAIVLL